MGSPIDGTWNGAAGAYYVGAGGGEMIWVLVSLGLCALAIVLGAAHEFGSYRNSRR